VFKVEERSHGTFEVIVEARTARIRPRGDDNPALEKGRVMAVAVFAARVKLVAVPIVAPAAFTNDTLPVHDAAVPEVVFVARLIRFTPMVSVLASPTTGNE
jgi:hypothetical protein